MAITRSAGVEMGAVGVSARTKTLSAEELADRIVPADPRIAPDGSRVVFVADAVGRKEEKKRRTLWIADGDGPARKLTAGTAEDSDPRWSPDGTRVLFRSDRLAKDKDKDKDKGEEEDENEQRLFLLPLAGGEAQPLGELSGALSQPAWSPDGAAVAVLRRDPEPDAVKARKKARDDAVVVEEDSRFTRLWTIDVATGRGRCLTTGEGEVRAYAWTPDGDHLVTVTTMATEYDAVYGQSELSLAALAGGAPRPIARFGSTPSSLVVVETAEGPVVAVQADGGRALPGDSLWVVPLSGGEPRCVIPDHRGVVEEIAPLPSSQGQVAARIVEGTHGRLFAVDVLSGATTPLAAIGAGGGSTIAGPSVAASGDRLAAIWTDAVTPEEVYLGSVSGDAAAVTAFGASFAGRLQPTEHVSWTSDDGVEIEGLLTLPNEYEPGKRYPLVVEIHGGPSWQWEDRVMLDWHDWAQLLASHGYAVLLPNPRGSTAYGHAFQRLLQDDVGGGECRDLISGARAMIERGIADPERLGIGGWSWGGYLTAWTITQTGMFRAAVMGAGLSNMLSDHGQGDIPSANLLFYPGQPYHHMDAYWKSSPIRHVAAVTTPTLILHGDDDARVHPAQGMEYFRALKILSVPVRFVRYPREGHGIGERAHQIDLMNRILDWFKRYL